MKAVTIVMQVILLVAAGCAHKPTPICGLYMTERHSMPMKLCFKTGHLPDWFWVQGRTGDDFFKAYRVEAYRYEHN